MNTWSDHSRAASVIAMADLFSRVVRVLGERYRAYFRSHPAVPFAVAPAGGAPHLFGIGEPSFTIRVNDPRGAKALLSLDQLQVAVAYLRGHLDLDGDVMAVLSMRRFFPDFHPIAWLARFAPAVLRGRSEHDRRAISAHYDRESDFFLTFMDTRHRCYTQGVFASDDEPLEDAMTRKMDLAIEAIGAKPGDHVLEVGGGWGAFVEHAGRQGIRVTTLTLAEESEQLPAGAHRETRPTRHCRAAACAAVRGAAALRRDRQHGRHRAPAELQGDPAQVRGAGEAGRPRVPGRAGDAGQAPGVHLHEPLHLSREVLPAGAALLPAGGGPVTVRVAQRARTTGTTTSSPAASGPGGSTRPGTTWCAGGAIRCTAGSASSCGARPPGSTRVSFRRTAGS